MLILLIFEIIIIFSCLNDKRKDFYLDSCIFLNLFSKKNECIMIDNLIFDPTKQIWSCILKVMNFLIFRNFLEF